MFLRYAKLGDFDDIVEAVLPAVTEINREIAVLDLDKARTMLANIIGAPSLGYCLLVVDEDEMTILGVLLASLAEPIWYSTEISMCLLGMYVSPQAKPDSLCSVGMSLLGFFRQDMQERGYKIKSIALPKTGNRERIEKLYGRYFRNVGTVFAS